MSEYDKDFRYQFAKWQGKITAILENLEAKVDSQSLTIKELVTKEVFIELKEDFKEFKEGVRIITSEINKVKLTATAEGAKSGQRWALIIGIGTISFAALLNLLLFTLYK